MRICILTHADSPFGFEYAEAFRRRGHEVELFSMSDVPAFTPSVPVRYIDRSGFDPKKTRSRMPYLRLIGPVRKALAEYRPDIVMAIYLSSAGMLGALCRPPGLVVSALGSDVFSHVGSWLWRRILSWVCRRAALVHAVSEPLAETLRDRCGADESKIIVAPIGIRTDMFGLIDPESRPDAGRLICTRGHGPVYDQKTILKALVILRGRGIDFHMTFASSRAADVTRKLTGELGIDDRVTFLNGFNYDDLPGMLGRSDVYVSASLSDGTSNSLLEALSTGTFPVVSDIPANRPWIADGRTGLLFPPGQEAALADCLERALADRKLRASSAAVNREIAVSKGDVHNQADRLLSAFERCLAKR